MAESEVPHRGAPPPNDALSAARVAFPQTPEDFDSDPRVSFSKLDSKWILEDDDGSEWEWNDVAKRWMPSVRFLHHHYSFVTKGGNSHLGALLPLY